MSGMFEPRGTRPDLDTLERELSAFAARTPRPHPPASLEEAAAELAGRPRPAQSIWGLALKSGGRRSFRALRAAAGLAAVAALVVGLGWGLSQRQASPIASPSGSPLPVPTDALGGMASMQLMDSTHGWVLTEEGRLYVTADAGKSWQPRDPGTLLTAAQHLQFADAQHGWVVVAGDQGSNRLLRTADGGGTWQSIPAPAPYKVFGRPVFLDASAGFAALASSPSGPWSLARTGDGGGTWNPVGPLPEGASDELAFLDTTTGWSGVPEGIAGELSHLYVTRDGGTTWVPAPLPAGKIGVSETLAPAPSLPVPVGPSTALLEVDFLGNQKPDTFITTDSGRTWQEHSSLYGAPRVASFTPADRWTRTENGTIAWSADQGRTWTEVASAGLTGQIEQIQFVDAKLGWALAGSQLYATADGGRTWRTIGPGKAPGPLPTAPPLVAPEVETSHLIDAQHGIASLTGSPDLYITADGGTTWTVLRGSVILGSAGLPAFADPEHAYRVVSGTNADTIEYTTDGGRTWHPAELPQGYVRVIAPGVLDRQRAYLELTKSDESLAIARTSDGGQSWQIAGTLPSDVIAVAMLEDGSGWANGGPVAGGNPDRRSEKLYVTRDRGRSWQQTSVRSPAGTPYPAASTYDLPLVTGPHSAVLGVSSANTPNTFDYFVTFDDGQTWTHIQAPPGYANAGSYMGAGSFIGSDVWVVPEGNAVAWTHDAGKTWTTLPGNGLPDKSSVRSVEFTDGQHGWALVDVGQPGDAFQAPGQLYATDDGGRTWRLLTPGLAA